MHNKNKIKTVIFLHRNSHYQNVFTFIFCASFKYSLCLYSTFHKVELIILFVEMIATFVTDNHLLFVNDTTPDFPIFTEEGESCL